MKKLSFILALCTLLMGSLQALAADPNRLTYDDFLLQLAAQQERESNAADRITALGTDIDRLRDQLGRTRSRIQTTWNQIYSELKTDEAGHDAYGEMLEELSADVMDLNNLSAEELIERQEGMQQVNGQIEDAAGQGLAKLSYNAGKISELERVMQAVQARMERAANSWYSVIRGDCLWYISGKDKIYDDPFQWTRLYSANQDQIRDPDLIFPDQRLAVPRMTQKGQYLVVRGDSFVKIAEKLYGDATRWRGIQEANMSLLDTMGGLFPGMVLSLP